MTLADIARQVHAGQPLDCPWTLFRVNHFPDFDNEEAAAALGEWSDAEGIKVEFRLERVEAAGKVGGVIYLLLKKNRTLIYEFLSAKSLIQAESDIPALAAAFS